MRTTELLQRAEGRGAQPFMIWREEAFHYDWLREELLRGRDLLARANVRRGAVVSMDAGYTPRAVGLLLALLDHDAIIVPLHRDQPANEKLRSIAEVEVITDAEGGITRSESPARHPFLRRLQEAKRPGLVLFSSGSTGMSKAILHDFGLLLEKFRRPRPAKRMIPFLLFDHIGGINTMLYTLSNGGCLIAVEARDPDAVSAAIERHRAQVLPVTPTFLQLLMISEAYRRFDLSSLELVTYGTEPMPEATLLRFHDLFPDVGLQQTYGLSELGILRSRSKAPDSLWVQLGGEGYETRVREGLLEIKARSSMLGYLNALSPFTEDGWFQTGDAVEREGEYYRILGRASELINVGGEKVFPAEVEGVLEQMPGVEASVVHGEKSAILGAIVVAKVNLTTGETPAQFRRRMREHCRERLAPYKIPQKVILEQAALYGNRFKKNRR